MADKQAKVPVIEEDDEFEEFEHEGTSILSHPFFAQQFVQV